MKPLPWSFSSLSNFTTCPKQYYHTRIAKDVKQEEGEAAMWGDYVHREFEKYLNTINHPAWGDERAPLPDNLETYRPYLDGIAAGSGEMRVECKYAITRDMTPCDFHAADVWCRAILDVLHLDGQQARILDHKTGKMKANSKQLKLSALLVFAHHPEVMLVKTGFFWLKEMKLTKESFARIGEDQLWHDFLPDLQQYREAFQSETFHPRPSGLCNGWCPVTACEYWKPKRVTK